MPKRSPEYMAAQRVRFCEAALACFRRKGVVASNLTDICQESGLSMGALYKHFSSRDELLEAVLEYRLAWRNELLKGSTWPELRAALLDYRRSGEDNPFWREFQGVADWNETLRDIRIREGRVILVQIEHLLERFIAAGEIAPPFDVKRVAQLISIIIDGSMVDVRTAPTLRVEMADLSAYLDRAGGARAETRSKTRVSVAG